MAVPVRVPKFDEDTGPFQVEKWFVEWGDNVNVGDPIVELSSPTGLHQLTATNPGRINSTHGQPGQKGILVGSVVASLVEASFEMPRPDQMPSKVD